MKRLGRVVVMALLAFPVGRVAAEMEKPVSYLQKSSSFDAIATTLKTSNIELATYAVELPNSGKCSAVAIAPTYLLTADHCIRDKSGNEAIGWSPIEEWKLPTEGVNVSLSTKDGHEFSGKIIASSLYAETALIKIDGVSQWLEVGTEIAPGDHLESAGFPGVMPTYTVEQGVVIGDDECADEWQPYVMRCVGHTIITMPGWSGGGIADKDGRLVGIVHGYTFSRGNTIGIMVPGDVICSFINEAIAPEDREKILSCNTESPKDDV